MTEVVVTTSVRLQNAGMPDGPAGAPLLAADGPRVVLGGEDPLTGPVAPSATSLFGPRGARLFEDGSLVVADTGHHRVLIWNRAPSEDNVPADVVLGQPGFEREGRNALGPASALTCNVPTGVSEWKHAAGSGMLVADTWNNRVLLWHVRPTRSGTPPDLVLGHADFDGEQPNRGADVGADTLHWPTQALEHEGKLIVCDTGNRRVLIWNELPTRNGQPADVVLGQPNLRERSDNGGEAAGPRGLRWPHDACIHRGDLWITDAGDNRILRFAGIPEQHHAAAQVCIGQVDAFHVDHNQAQYWPTASTLNMPYAIDAHGDWLLCADTANSRLLGYEQPTRDALAATRLSGQPHFHAKGDNRWRAPVRDSLCWPYGLKLGRGHHTRTAVVADTGNHRVCLWELAP
jgi:hypothetical protein